MIWSGLVLIVYNLILKLKINYANLLNAKNVIMIFAFSVRVKETQLCNMELSIIGHNVNFSLIMMILKTKFQKIAKNARSSEEKKSVGSLKI